jgi:hypothetical protein
MSDNDMAMSDTDCCGMQWNSHISWLQPAHIESVSSCKSVYVLKIAMLLPDGGPAPPFRAEHSGVQPRSASLDPCSHAEDLQPVADSERVGCDSGFKLHPALLGRRPIWQWHCTTLPFPCIRRAGQPVPRIPGVSPPCRWSVIRRSVAAGERSSAPYWNSTCWRAAKECVARPLSSCWRLPADHRPRACRQ